MVITLPFPPPKLSRNGSQKDYQGKAAAARKYKEDCQKACLAAKGRIDVFPDRPVMVQLTYHAHDRRRRDLDNLLAMTKQGLDAVSEHIGIDDHLFEFTLRRGSVQRPAIVKVVI